MASNSASTIITLESLIKSSQARFEELSTKQHQLKQILESILENDPQYVEADKIFKKAAKEKLIAKSKVISQPEAKTTSEKIKDNQFQLRDLKIALSDYLAQYVNLSGSQKIETSDGTLFDIVYTAKLIKSKS